MTIARRARISFEADRLTCLKVRGEPRRMKTTKQIATIILIILLGAIAYGWFRTGGAVKTPQTTAIVDQSHAAHGPAIDQSSLEAARRLVQMPTREDEGPLAEAALHLGDREMDLAFAAAVSDAREHPAVLSAEAKQTQTTLQNAEKALDRDKARVDELTAALAKATGAKKDSLDGQLQQAKIQVELDQDEVDNAKQELDDAGGDAQGQIEELVKEHAAASSVADATKVKPSAPPDLHGLIHHYQGWSELHKKTMQLRQAKQDAESAAAAFATKRAALQSSIKTKTETVPDKPQSGFTPPVNEKSSSPPSETSTAGTSTDLVNATKRRSAAVKALTNVDERIEDQNRLAETYGKWMEVVGDQERAVIHRGLRGVAIIVAILLIGIFFDSWLKSLLGRVKLDARQGETLHAVVSTALQIIALGLILLVIFGPPGQLGTFLGLAGAGLTVALKDFIVSFFGWFVLMGRNGIRLGDWVEINGVTGEVAELGMFHTVLLETGNWTDSGHPTGRRVTFTNNFAIEGHYFNFSTSGQWLWDELTLVVDSSQSPYPIVDAIQKTVLEATSESAGEAEKEWKNAAHSRNVGALSAAPAINLKPVSGGVEIAVRYITRANERYAMRSKLYQAAVSLISKKGGQETGSVSVTEKPEPKPA
jgi:small-conductance mechanosensitive channel